MYWYFLRLHFYLTPFIFGPGFIREQPEFPPPGGENSAGVRGCGERDGLSPGLALPMDGRPPEAHPHQKVSW